MRVDQKIAMKNREVPSLTTLKKAIAAVRKPKHLPQLLARGFGHFDRVSKLGTKTWLKELQEIVFIIVRIVGDYISTRRLLGETEYSRCRLPSVLAIFLQC